MVNKKDVFDNKLKFENRIIHIPFSECIYFGGFLGKDNYSEFQFRTKTQEKKNILAHRASYILSNNIELETNNIIMHLCDNPECINPNHLRLGTHNDNVQDRVIKNRSAKGIDNGRYVHGEYCKKLVSQD